MPLVDSYCFTPMLLQICFIFKEIHGKYSDTCFRVQVSDKLSDHTIELGRMILQHLEMINDSYKVPPCCSNVAINSLKAYLSHNCPFPSSMGHNSQGMSLPSTEGVDTDAKSPNDCLSMLSKERPRSKERNVKGKIKMESVLLRELCK